MFAVETDTGTWIGVAVALVTLFVAVAAVLFQRTRTRLEYVVTTNALLLPGSVAGDLEVSHHDVKVRDPALAVIRIVNTGDRGIRREDFEDDLIVHLDGARELVSASWSSTRPARLRPALRIEGNLVRITPELSNPGDMLELQVLSAGRANAIEVDGRAPDLVVSRRRALPYPPGSGAEGEMLGGDRFMWWVFIPGAIVGGTVWALAAVWEDSTGLGRLAIFWAGAAALGLYWLQVRYLVRRRRRWRPDY
jgi:hypothetical protein